MQIKEDIVFPQDVQLTNEAKDFILKILNKNPVERLRIEKLLEHPFLKRSCEPADMQIWIGIFLYYSDFKVHLSFKYLLFIFS